MSDFTVMEYLYRDANNFKAFGRILLSGKFSDVNITEIQSLLESSEYFVAEQVGISPLYSQLWKYSNGPTIADHAYHEFVEFRAATDEEITSLAVWGNVTTLISKFHHVKKDWDCGLSVHSMGL